MIVLPVIAGWVGLRSEISYSKRSWLRHIISLKNPCEVSRAEALSSFETLLFKPGPRFIEFEDKAEKPPWVDEPRDEYVNEETYENLLFEFIESLRMVWEGLSRVTPFLDGGTAVAHLALKLNSLLNGLLVELLSIFVCWAPESWAWTDVSLAWAVVGNPVLRPISWQKELFSFNSLLPFLFLNNKNQTITAHTRIPPILPTILPTIVPVFDFDVPWFWLSSKPPFSQCW